MLVAMNFNERGAQWWGQKGPGTVLFQNVLDHAGPTSHAHFASTPADGSHYDLASDDTGIRWPIRSHDQARNLQYDSNRTVRHLSLAPDSKQATPTACDPCTLAGVPTMDLSDTPDL
jgi:hypothetical protein